MKLNFMQIFHSESHQAATKLWPSFSWLLLILNFCITCWAYYRCGHFLIVRCIAMWRWKALHRCWDGAKSGNCNRYWLFGCLDSADNRVSKLLSCFWIVGGQKSLRGTDISSEWFNNSLRKQTSWWTYCSLWTCWKAQTEGDKCCV